MTFLGKILTVMITIMSVVFMSFAIVVYATHKNWKLVVDNPQPQQGLPLGLKQRIERQQLTVNRLRALLSDAQKAVEREQAARRFALAALQTKLEVAEQGEQEAQRQYQELLVSSGQSAMALKTSTDTLDSLTKEVEGLRTEIRNAQTEADQIFVASVQLTDEINQLRGVKENVEERRQQLALRLSRMVAVLDAHGLTEFTSTDDKPPAVDGIVLAVLKNRVEISIGYEEGLKPGHELDVFRGKTYLGRIVIRRTDVDKAVGELIPDFNRGAIRKGDRVATKLG